MNKSKTCSLAADKNKDKKITLQELYRYSYDKVKKENSKQHVVVYPKKSQYIVLGKFE